MPSSERVRLAVLFLFFVTLVCFGVLYRPTSAISYPAAQSNSIPAPVSGR